MSYQPYYKEFANQLHGYLDANPRFILKSEMWNAFQIVFDSKCKYDFGCLFGHYMTFEERKQMIEKYPLPDVPKSMVLYAMGESNYTKIKLTGAVKYICETYLKDYLI